MSVLLALKCSFAVTAWVFHLWVLTLQDSFYSGFPHPEHKSLLNCEAWALRACVACSRNAFWCTQTPALHWSSVALNLGSHKWIKKSIPHEADQKDNDFFQSFVFAFRLTLKEENFASSTGLSVSDWWTHPSSKWVLLLVKLLSCPASPVQIPVSPRSSSF